MLYNDVLIRERELEIIFNRNIIFQFLPKTRIQVDFPSKVFLNIARTGQCPIEIPFRKYEKPTL